MMLPNLRSTRTVVLAAILAAAAACTGTSDRPTAPATPEATSGPPTRYTDDDGGNACPKFDPLCQDLNATEIAELDGLLDRFTRFDDQECFAIYVRAKMALAGGFRLTKFTYYGQVPGYSNIGGAYLVTETLKNPTEISINSGALNGGSPGEAFKDIFHESHHVKKHEQYASQWGSNASGYMVLLSDGEDPAESAAQSCYNPAG